MPRPSKGPRLYLRDGKGGRGWIILDGNRQRGTGCSPGDRIGAERALQAYLAQKHTETVTQGSRHPSAILIDDVLALYVRERLPHVARPHAVKLIIISLRKFWGGRLLSDVSGRTCREYVKFRTTEQVARQELTYLRAAINYHRREGLCSEIIAVTTPPPAPQRDRWLTRGEAAQLIWHAWRYRHGQPGRTNPFPRRHIAKWMIVARYMGSRTSVICSASIEDMRPSTGAWIDLSTGMFYGRSSKERVTKKRKQLVKVPGPLLSHLRRWREKAKQRYAVEWDRKPVKSIKIAHASTVRAVGLEDVSPHIWRHTVATWLMQAGVDPWEAAGFLGVNYVTLMRVYGHHHPNNVASVHAALRRNR